MSTITPGCPVCRTRIHRCDVPIRLDRPVRERDPTVDPSLIDQPAISSLPLSERPVRLVREQFLLRRQNVETLLAELVRRRVRIITRQQRNVRGAFNPRYEVRPDTPEPSDSEHRNIEAGTDSSSDIEVLEVIMPNRERALVPYYAEVARVSQDSSTSRSRSPLSQDDSRVNSLAVVPWTPQLQNLQMDIAILQNQLEVIETLPNRERENPELIDIPDNESIISEDDNDYRPVPIQISGYFGRGRHTKYVVEWSDGSATLNKTADVSNSVPWLLADWRRKQRAFNQRVYRARMMERSRTDL